MEPIKYPPPAAFPELPPRGILPWVWQQFLGTLTYREQLIERRAATPEKTPYWHFLGHEIKRTEIAAGLWLGRMKEQEIVQ